VAVITNSSLLHVPAVRRELAAADLVMAKLDACSQDGLRRLSQPHSSITFSMIMKGLRQFRRMYKGIFTVQSMFVDENKADAAKIAALAKELAPNMVYINTPLRPSGCVPLSKAAMNAVKRCFTALDIPVLCVYDKAHGPVKPINLQDTRQRRGLEQHCPKKRKKDIICHGASLNTINTKGPANADL
ncbi:MAG: hypothetical protein Q7U74_02775, partial [Saprospiraceae bacterium]|nr:hypothetical protein [Saprospiraceae bacterium]